MTGLTLDAGALVAVERNDRFVASLLAVARRDGHVIAIPAGALGRVWRDGRRQARLARLLAASNVSVEPLDEIGAREAGQLCGLRGTSDVIDASVALCARARGDRLVTSDVDDFRRLDPSLVIIRA
jgi:predicted nucleic acid-binding protein